MGDWSRKGRTLPRAPAAGRVAIQKTRRNYRSLGARLSMPPPSKSGLFVVATPGRSVCDDNARALERSGRLRFLALGTRRGTAGVAPERTRLNPWIGLATFLSASALPAIRSE